MEGRQKVALLDVKRTPARNWEDSRLRQNAEFIQRVLESNQDCIKVLDLEGRLLYMNNGGQKIMEIDAFEETIKGEDWLSFWCGDDQIAAKAAFESACLGSTAKFDGYCATAKGTPRWWEVMVTPIFDEEQKVTEILSVSRDITARKNAEIALEARNRELSQFTSVVSHDLKAPLRGIHSLATWIAEDLEPIACTPEVKENIALLQRRVRRMDNLIDGLLEVARAGEKTLPSESVDVAALLDEVIDSAAFPAGFEIVSTQQLPKLTTKKLLLSQVFANFLSNAVKHHHKDTGRIEISAQDKGRCYQFEVADDGPGIPPSEQARMFEMFQTLEDDRQSTENTGIGLALIKKIVAAEGGKLWLEDNTPSGCRFCFTWPKREFKPS